MDDKVDERTRNGLAHDERSRLRQATMRDVAALAGVSLATVSRTLSGSAAVSPRLSRRVEAAAHKLDFAINVNARRLRGKSSGLVVVMLPDIANPFFSVLLQGIEEQARSQNMAVLIGDTGVDREIADNYWRLIEGQRADGVILLNGFVPFRRGARVADNYPVVVISERIEGFKAPMVGIDNVAAAFDAVSHLARLGHKRVAYICGPAANILTHQRGEGYRNAVAAHGLDVWPEAIQPGAFSIRAGRAATARLLSAAPPSAIFCANDEIAIGAMMEAKARGLRVPDNLSVVGFDDIELAQISDPPLTTVYQPRREMGRKAMQMLGRLIQDPTCSYDDILLDFKLVVRESSAPLGVIHTGQSQTPTMPAGAASRRRA
jgi:LacI family repressor for deo operon, udp, cdd, tsx, nupC, and nupG